MALFPALVAIMLAGEAHRPVREAGARFHDTARATAVLDARDALLARAGAGRVVRTATPGAARLQVRDLAVRHPGRRAATPSLAALDAAGGELLVVAGPSGAGKTTLLQVLAGTVDEAAEARGTVAVGGRVVVLGQDPQLPHAATVGEALGGAGPTGPAVLRRLGLDLDPDAPLGEAGSTLSAGQRRRLALARVLGDALADPAGTLVLLDEPTAHLDADAERAVVTELRALARAGALVVAVAHREALRAGADRVVDLGGSAGSVAANGRFAASTRANSPLAPSTPPANGEFRRLEAANSAFAAAAPKPWRGLPGAVVLGVGAALAGVALTASAAWLIARAAAQPPVLTLSIAVVAVRAFAVARPLLRYLERLAAHEDGLARVVRWRRRVVADLARRVPGAVAGRRGHLLARVVDDVDVRLDGLVRGALPLVVAGLALPLLLATATWASPAVGAAVVPGL
ncbi:MAG TPA: ATP-binding cassette domain-containing protein, partial [Actinomycetospora sp.]|nr:ATP-binding cassette domain-containing protein [Actinomycetospora sp.]